MNAARQVLYETSVKLLETARKQAIAEGMHDHVILCIFCTSLSMLYRRYDAQGALASVKMPQTTCSSRDSQLAPPYVALILLGSGNSADLTLVHATSTQNYLNCEPRC